jgi:glycine/D-amino acid oxidase-like deaminating enzyme
MAPKTGEVIADLLADRRPTIDLAPYRPERFA